MPEIPAPPREDDGVPAPEDYVHLEVRDTELILTNVSERPINAWFVKTVIRITKDNEGYSTYGVDAFHSSVFEDGEERWLRPGESVAVQKGGKPWIREDARTPETAIYYQVGAITFEGGEAVGDAEMVDRIFDRRRELARNALEAARAALSAAEGNAAAFEEIPDHYRRRLASYPADIDRVGALRADALRDYRVAFENLRPRDRMDLPSPKEVRR